jgi:hypothetical protein
MAYPPYFIAHQKTAFFAVYDAIFGGPGGVFEMRVLEGMKGLFPLYNKELRPIFGPFSDDGKSRS